MTDQERATRPRPRLPAALALLLPALTSALLLVLIPALPAQAHDRLESSAPADGAVLDIAPTSVVLTFSAPPIGLGAKVVVTGPDGAVVSSGDPRVVDRTVTEDLAGDLPAGQYRVEWRVTSSDGHPVSGELTYTASAPAPSTSPPSSSSTNAAPATASPASPSSSPAVDDDVPAGAASSSGPQGWVLAGVAVLALALAAGVGTALRRRR
ncbi:hypothetical protein SAMN06264364_11426 [Quadrisphaera granulorum]|uniref:CopC domain-containing protein n=1 Tax=Quadrisphaera granulorum TaxID=317664 RepID=A0A316A5H0_9ACTN|nr:copper resistance CopC family protein [Quadrisphaera granulorum]PWJ53131.1 hypothetical protein BXY45_11426 [Quadrisphaera granulorum]SZE97063.1 hypothetical protein SAMN06264364_11426 [Quadrisphaera granulorum]